MFGVEGYGLSADLNVSMVVAFPTWTGSEFQTDGLNERVHSRLSSCIIRVGVVGGGCRYRGEVVEKGSTAVGGQGNEQEWGR